MCSQVQARTGGTGDGGTAHANVLAAALAVGGPSRRAIAPAAQMTSGASAAVEGGGSLMTSASDLSVSMLPTSATQPPRQMDSSGTNTDPVALPPQLPDVRPESEALQRCACD